MSVIKKLLTKQNLILLILFFILGHNYYLQLEIGSVNDNSSEAIDFLQRHAEYFRDAANYAEEASEYAEEASEYAENAVEYSEKAYEKSSYAAEFAEKAYQSSFAYNCGYCP